MTKSNEDVKGGKRRGEDGLPHADKLATPQPTRIPFEPGRVISFLDLARC